MRVSFERVLNSVYLDSIILPLPVYPAFVTALGRPALWAGEVAAGTLFLQAIAQVQPVLIVVASKN